MSMFTKLGLLWCGIFLIWYGLYTLSNENRSLVSENIPLEESVLKEVSERLNVEAILEISKAVEDSSE